MRFLIAAIITLVLASCSNEEDTISGKWKVKTSYYQAQYEITQTENGYNCRVLNYNDGTHLLSSTDNDDMFLFKEI